MPMNTTLSDTALRQAAQRLAYQLSAALPAEETGFSAGFEARMDPLLRREKRRRTARLVWQRTAAALLTIVMAFGAALAVSPAARAAVGRWLRQMTTEVTAYRFPASQSAGTWTGNGPTWLPESYVMASDFTGDNGVRTMRYTSPQGDVMLAAVGFRSDQDISMEVRSHRTAGLSDILTGQRPQGEPGDPEGCDITEVQVRGRDAQFYQFRHLPDETRSVSVYSVLFYLDSPDSDAAPFYSVSIPERGRLLVWADEDAGQVFLLFGTPGQEDLCRMAESMYEEGSRS